MEVNEGPLEYDLTLQEVEFKTRVKRPDGSDGPVKEYLLREASGEAATKWREVVMSATRFNKDGKPSGVQGLSESEPLLVSLCVFPRDAKGGWSDRHITVMEVKSWPARVQKDLFERAKKISHLSEDADTEEAIQKRIAELTERLREIQEEQAALKKQPGDGEDGSSSPAI